MENPSKAFSETTFYIYKVHLIVPIVVNGKLQEH